MASMAGMAGFHALKHLPEEKVTDTITRRVLIGDKTMIDVFAPPREDFFPGADAPTYMQKG